MQGQRAEPTDCTLNRNGIVPIPQLVEKIFIINNNISKSAFTPTQTVVCSSIVNAIICYLSFRLNVMLHNYFIYMRKVFLSQ